ncbi:ankyrin repeat domain-containing protein, partial [Acinetobacter baumannii]
KAFELLAKTFDCFNDQKNVIEFLKTNAHLQFIITQFDALFFQNFVHSPQDIAKESIAGFDADHKTALHHACAQGDLSTVRTLIHVGAPLNVA